MNGIHALRKETSESFLTTPPCEDTSRIQPSRGFPGGAGVESLPANAGDTGSSPGLGRSHMPRSN